jgi:chromosome segregation protein
LAQRTEQREALAQRVYRARSSAERIELRLERTRETAQSLAERAQSRGRELELLRAQAAEDQPDEAGLQRIEALEAELGRLESDHQAELGRELAALEQQRAAAAADAERLAAIVEERRAALVVADEAAEVARRARRAAESSAESARREAANVGSQLAAANQFLRTHTSLDGGRSLADELTVEPGLELALAAALGGRLGAAVVPDRAAGSTLLDAAGANGGSALVTSTWAPKLADAESERAHTAPTAGARSLASLIAGPEATIALAQSLLQDAWVVDSLEEIAEDFRGVAVTAGGRAWFGATRELQQAPTGGSERVLAERNRRDSLIVESEQAVRAEQDAIKAVEAAAQAVTAADSTRDEADRTLRDADRERTAAVESERRAAWLIEQRRAAPQQGASAVRRAQVEGELAAERRVAERAAKDRAERAARIERLGSMVERDRRLVPVAERLAAALEQAQAAVATRVEVLEAELEADREAGEGVAAALRACATEEAQIQQRLREHGDAVTTAEVRAQQIRDQESDASEELTGLAERLGLADEPAPEALPEEEAAALRTRIERLQRRREQLGPVNPLAKAEYDEAIAHVEELERQRTDLETALRDLRAFIRDCDRQIRETFEETFTAAAQNFERLAEQLFPGGRGRLRLVRDEVGPKPVLGGAAPPQDGTEEVRAEAAAEAAAEAEAEAGEDGGLDPDDALGVEIEITPAGKSMKRLTLLSGGEKSMTAIAFLFAVFLARPCPFYILDEVEAALDDLNIGRFLDLLRANADRAQFIVVTHQKRTMEAADTLYGVSMGDDGVSKVISRKLPREVAPADEAERAA